MPLTPIASRLNAVNAVIQNQKTSMENHNFSRLENQKFMVIQFILTKDYESSREIYPRKCGEADGAWNLGMNVVAMQCQ